MSQILISEKTFEKARKLIRENKENSIIFSSEDDDLNRKILEKENISILLLNQKNRKDFTKQRNSGFDSVMAKIASKKKIIVGINLDELINQNIKEKAQIIARIKQNIDLCKKYKVKSIFLKFAIQLMLMDKKQEV